MAIKDTIENNPVIWTLGMLFAGFLAGIGCYKGVLEMADLHAVPKSAQIAKQDERIVTETEYKSLTAANNASATQKLADSEALRQRYKLILTSLATSIDGKVRYEMTQLHTQPALRIYIQQLNDTINQAKGDHLLDP